MDDDRADRQLCLQLARQNGPGLGTVRLAIQSQHFAYFIGLLFIKTEDDIELLFEARDQLQRA